LIFKKTLIVTYFTVLLTYNKVAFEYSMPGTDPNPSTEVK